MSDISEVLDTPVAHRGLHDRTAGIIENSRSAFEQAIAHNYAIECDLQLSGDGVPVVYHDDLLDRLTDQSGPLHNLSAAQLAHVPLKGSKAGDTPMRFDDFLALVNGRVALFVELKDQIDGRNRELAEAAARMLKDYVGPVAIITFSPYLLAEIRKQGFKGPRAIITGRFDEEWAKERLSPWRRFVLRHMLHYPWTRFDFVDASHEGLNLPMVRLFRALGFPVAAWTIRSQSEADAALKYCDQIAFEDFIPASG